MEIDVHNMLFKTAKNYIIESINKCYRNNIGVLRVIHGYNNGTKIKDWLKGANLGDNVVSVMADLLNSGVSIIYVKTKLK